MNTYDHPDDLMREKLSSLNTKEKTEEHLQVAMQMKRGELAEKDKQQFMRDVQEQADGVVETISLPWPLLSGRTKALKPGCLMLLGGPTKTGKTFFLSTIAWSLFQRGYVFSYLPLEDSRKDFLWRMLAIITGDYTMIDDAQATAGLRSEALEQNSDIITELGFMVSENFRVNKKDADGNTVIPPVPPEKVLAWVKSRAETSRVVIVDPIAQIEFRGKQKWEAEGDFVRQLLAIATDKRVTVIVAGHTVKRGGANAGLTPTCEDFQGAAEWVRLAHTVLLLDGHEHKTSKIFRAGGLTADITHNRTVIIGAARNGSGTRQRIAFEQSKYGPKFEELGAIAPGGKK